MAQVTWGVLGCANFAYRRAIPAMLQSPSVNLLGVASRSLDKARAFCAEFKLPLAFEGYDAMLADPRIEAVYIPLPNGLHAEWIIKAVECGKHVLCEKPLTVSAAEAALVAEAASRTGRRVMEAFMWRFHAQHERAKAAVENGDIGPLRLVRAAFSFTLARGGNVRLDPDLGGGSLLDVGCYPISAARFYFADEPVAVFAQGFIDPQFKVDIRMCGLMTFAQGRALIDSAFDLPYRTEIELVGEKGTIVIPKPWLPGPAATLIINGDAHTFEAGSHYVAIFEHFSQCLLHGSAPRYGPEDALLQMRAMDAVRSSMKSGKAEIVGG